MNPQIKLDDPSAFSGWPFNVLVKPEIRKGCVWEVSLSFPESFIKTVNLNQLILSGGENGASVVKNEKKKTTNVKKAPKRTRASKKPSAISSSTDAPSGRVKAEASGERYLGSVSPLSNATTTTHKIVFYARSKLSKPVVALPFVNVGELVSPGVGESVNLVDGNAILKVRFNERPRSAFHKHGDVMLFCAAISQLDVSFETLEAVVKAETLLTSSENSNGFGHDVMVSCVELVFRGGTGSIHGAKARHEAQQALMGSNPPPVINKSPLNTQSNGMVMTNPRYPMNTGLGMKTVPTGIGMKAVLTDKDMAMKSLSTPPSPLLMASNNHPQRYREADDVVEADEYYRNSYKRNGSMPDDIVGGNSSSTLLNPFDGLDGLWKLGEEHSVPVFEDFDAKKFCDDFLPISQPQALMMDQIMLPNLPNRRFSQSPQDNEDWLRYTNNFAFQEELLEDGTSGMFKLTSEDPDNEVTENDVTAVGSESLDEHASVISKFSTEHLEREGGTLFQILSPQHINGSPLRDDSYIVSQKSIANSAAGSPSSTPPLPRHASSSVAGTLVSYPSPKTEDSSKANMSPKSNPDTVSSLRKRKLSNINTAEQELSLSKRLRTSNEHNAKDSEEVQTDENWNNVLSHAEKDHGKNEKRKPNGRNLIEIEYFQKLFFNCLHYLTLAEIAKVCTRARIPIFVKNADSVYIYVNPIFCGFILTTAHVEGVLHKSTEQILNRKDAAPVAEHDKFLLSHGKDTVKAFNVNIFTHTVKVLKQWTVLRDGTKVIIGAVVSTR